MSGRFVSQQIHQTKIVEQMIVVFMFAYGLMLNARDQLSIPENPELIRMWIMDEIMKRLMRLQEKNCCQRKSPITLSVSRVGASIQWKTGHPLVS